MSIMNFTDEDSESAIFQAIGRASMCWEHLEGAGVFDDGTASQIGEELLAHLRKLRLVGDRIE